MLFSDRPFAGLSRWSGVAAAAFGALALRALVSMVWSDAPEGDFESHVRIDPAFVRPVDPVPLPGDPTKSNSELDWSPETSFEEMIIAMVEHALATLFRSGAVPAKR